jgi:hypothetical protein
MAFIKVCFYFSSLSSTLGFIAINSSNLTMAPALQFQTLTNIVITDEERISGTLSPEHAAIAIHALHTDGLVCLEKAVSLDHVAVLNEKLCSEAKSLSAKRGTHFVNVR